MQLDDYYNSVVRVFNKTNFVVGAGCLTTHNLILTCAHVVRDALGISKDNKTDESSVVGQNILIDLPYRDNTKDFQHVAKVESYFPQKNDGTGDVAILKLATDDLQPDNQFIRIVNYSGTVCKVYGFPEGHERNGILVDDLVVKGKLPSGVVQLSTNTFDEILIQRGFSGAPVWSEDYKGIIGIIKSRDSKNRAAFMLPSETLVLYNQELQEVIYPFDKQGKKWKEVVNGIGLLLAGVSIGVVLNEISHHSLENHSAHIGHDYTDDTHQHSHHSDHYFDNDDF